MSRGIAKSIIKSGRFQRTGKNGSVFQVTIVCGAAVALTSISTSSISFGQLAK
jgi:hypothetical protein